MSEWEYLLEGFEDRDPSSNLDDVQSGISYARKQMKNVARAIDEFSKLNKCMVEFNIEDMNDSFTGDFASATAQVRNEPWCVVMLLMEEAFRNRGIRIAKFGKRALVGKGSTIKRVTIFSDYFGPSRVEGVDE